MPYLMMMVFVLMLNGCSRMQVTSDYNPQYDFTSVVSYAIVPSSQPQEETLTSGRIVQALQQVMEGKGYALRPMEVADVHLRFYTDVRSKTYRDTEYHYVGLYRYGYLPMMSVPTTRVRTYEEGVLIIDVIQGQDHSVIWRGVATDSIQSFDTPKERISYIYNMIHETMMTFPRREQ